ncbi:hypothetical protein niasHT_023031 [Heterodera trifolii]|uniref:Uncharacterized protein n=1 Tax=Heterodera trifolii TaxID=157864 RepID=A0ABD2JWN0_9BILA
MDELDMDELGLDELDMDELGLDELDMDELGVTALEHNGNKSGKDRWKHEDNIVTETAISDPPALLGIAAFVLFFAGTLVGPQFPLARFRAFVNRQIWTKAQRPFGSRSEWRWQIVTQFHHFRPENSYFWQNKL